MASEANSEVVHRKKHHGHSSHSQRMEDIQKAALAEEHGKLYKESRCGLASSPVLFLLGRGEKRELGTRLRRGYVRGMCVYVYLNNASHIKYTLMV